RATELRWGAARAKQRAAELQVDRMAALAGEGLESQRNYELAVRNVAEARAGTLEARADLEAARADRAAEQAARESRTSELDATISSARDSLQAARARRAGAEETLAKVERALARQRSLVIRAPRAGMLTHVRAREQSAFVRQGEKIAVLIPDTYRRAVELTVSGIDAPLIVAGQTVQLQFEGWPAVQLGGWPEAAVGTFKGEVAFVDAQASPTGQFRVVVLPDSESDWPSSNLLRQGNLANGWVLLNRVTLGYELWRQLNGFPPDLPEKAARVSGIGVKKAKAEP
ncbi:MAG: HlyD family secretion protein, partial [bacterium]